MNYIDFYEWGEFYSVFFYNGEMIEQDWDISYNDVFLEILEKIIKKDGHSISWLAIYSDNIEKKLIDINKNDISDNSRNLYEEALNSDICFVWNAWNKFAIYINGEYVYYIDCYEPECYKKIVNVLNKVLSRTNKIEYNYNDIDVITACSKFDQFLNIIKTFYNDDDGVYKYKKHKNIDDE